MGIPQSNAPLALFFKKYFLFFIFALSLSFNVLLANDVAGPSIFGAWSTECNDSSTLEIDAAGHFLLNINDNQIYVNGKVKKTKLNEYDLFYESPADLGRGGMMLHWERFSKTKPIARLNFLPGDTIVINWHGFYDEVDHVFVWTTQPDFFNEKNKKIIMRRCASPTQR
jgi:hypothetical protein